MKDRNSGKDSKASKSMTRRIALRWIAAAPAAAAVVPAALAQIDERTGFDNLDREEPPPLPSNEASEAARCLVKAEDDLKRSEKAKILEEMPGLEGALSQLRDYELPDAVEPAFVFRAMHSRGSGSGGDR